MSDDSKRKLREDLAQWDERSLSDLDDSIHWVLSMMQSYDVSLAELSIALMHERLDGWNES